MIIDSMFKLFKPKKTIEDKKIELRTIDPTLEECGPYLRGECPSCTDIIGYAYNLIISFEDDVAMCYNCGRHSCVEMFKHALPQALRLRKALMKGAGTNDR